jgi:hypothetical protein
MPSKRLMAGIKEASMVASDPGFTISLERAEWSDEERRRRVARAFAVILALETEPHDPLPTEQNDGDRQDGDSDGRAV